MIGGKGKILEIDVSQFGKKKPTKNGKARNIVKCPATLGIIERSTDEKLG